MANEVVEADGQMEKFQELVENWYEDSMERVSGWFKRRAHTITLVIMAVTVSTVLSSSNGIAITVSV